MRGQRVDTGSRSMGGSMSGAEGLGRSHPSSAHLQAAAGCGTVCPAHNHGPLASAAMCGQVYIRRKTVRGSEAPAAGGGERMKQRVEEQQTREVRRASVCLVQRSVRVQQCAVAPRGSTAAWPGCSRHHQGRLADHRVNQAVLNLRGSREAVQRWGRQGWMAGQQRWPVQRQPQRHALCDGQSQRLQPQTQCSNQPQ